MVKKEYYEILGIEENATESDIRKAYIRLARETHPDKGGKEEEFKKVNKAYEILIDKSKRKAYDNGQNVSVEKYGYDYGEAVEESAIGEHLKDLNYLYLKLRDCDSSLASDYHLVRGKRFLQVLRSYYEPICKKIGWNKFFMDYAMSSVHTGNGLVWMTNPRGWEGNINHFKDLLNKARAKLGLDPLTDQDLQIEGNNQNEVPKIPNNGQNPKPIKDGVVNIEEYNSLYHGGNHETIRKYKKLRGAIYNTSEDWSKYQAVNSALLQEIDAKDAEVDRGFHKIWSTDSETKMEETKKFNERKLEIAKEAIKLMEKIIEESKNSKPAVENTQSGNKKRKAEDELATRQEVSKKNKTVGDELSRLIHEAQGLSKYEELEAKIKEIDKYQGEVVYNEDYQEEIKQLKSKLGNLDKVKHRNNIIKKIETNLTESGIKEEDLGEELKQELTKIRNGEIEEVNKVNEVESKIVAKTGEKKAVNNLNEWLNQAQKLINGVIKGTTAQLQEKLQEIKKGLQSFQSSTNVYWDKAYQNHKEKVKSALAKLENYSVQNNTEQPSRSFFRRPEVIVPLSILVVVLAIAAAVVIRKRKQVKVK